MPDANKETNVLNKVLKQFKETTKAPEIYLRQQNERAEKNKVLVKSLYDFAKLNENQELCRKSRNAAVGFDTPIELILEHMDEEQIWQQLELQNNALWERCLEKTSKLLSINEDRYELPYRCAGDDGVLNDVDNFNDEEDEDNLNINNDLADDSNDSDDTDSDDDSDAEGKSSKSNSKTKSNVSEVNHGRSSIVDDQFFKLSEMEAFLDSEDKKEVQKLNGKPDANEDSEEDIDYFNDDLSDEEEDNLKYSEFFDAKGTAEDEEEEDEEERKARLRSERQERYKLKAKRNKADLGFDESDLDDVDDEELEKLGSGEEDEEVEGEENDSNDENGDNSERRIKFDLSKNEYLSDDGSDNADKIQQDDDDDLSENENDEEEEGEKSSFQLRQDRLKNRIANMEAAALGEKSWQLKGEIDSTSRPKNSLLEEVLEFESTTRPAPIITEETTQRLEDIIKQRIKDKAWDDVERKIKPINEPQEYRKALILDSEKSKESLAQIYEKDYLKAVEKLNPSVDVDDKADEPQEYKKIRDEMRALFLKLDALSNFFYTPKPVAPEAKIITNIPAINMEEVAPIGVSDGALLAPEEIKARAKGDDIGRSERTRTDKNRERRQKKTKQKRKHAALEKRALEKEKLGIKSSSKEEQKRILDKVTKNRNVHKSKETIDNKLLKSSKAFFTQLQDQASSTKAKKATKTKRNDSLQNEKSAKRFKL